tara:strand:+ start:16799 stop:17059 length:261 start_codon:yes stop_codon:yes gene_type:complete
MSDNNPNQWHMKKEINLAHVIVTVSMVITMMWFFADLDKRVDGNTRDIVHSKLQRAEDQKRTREDNSRLYKQLDNLNKKIDRLLAK